MSQPRIVIDRIEGERAVLTFGNESVEVPLAFLPPGAGEGSVLSLTIDPASAADARAAAEARLARLRARNPNPPTEFDL